MEKKVKFEEIGDKYLEISRELREECIKYIKDVIEECGSLNFSECDTSLCVSYNGGNHPEYDSNCFSTVYSVALDNDNNIILNIEEVNDYDIEELPTEEVYGLADFIKNIYLD